MPLPTHCRMKKLIILFAALLEVLLTFGQNTTELPKFSANELKTDLDFLKQQVFNVHANPFTELSQTQYQKLFDDIESSITDSLTAVDFYRLVKPVVSYLSDEHAQIGYNGKLIGTYFTSSVFLPITLTKKGKDYVVDNTLTDVAGIVKGDVITQINNEPVNALVNRNIAYATGFRGQRLDKAMQQFGLWYGWSTPYAKVQYEVKTGAGKTVVVPGVDIKVWQKYLNAASVSSTAKLPLISYSLYKDAGYINANSFNVHNNREMDSIKNVLKTVFQKISTDKPKYLFIDVSNNGGGNSEVGDAMIDYFYAKPYLNYQCNWRRSDEYLKLMQSWGIKDSVYAAKAAGSLIHFDAEKVFPSSNNPLRYNGKVYIIVGPGTFSSAMMFATVIKDNKIATLAGQVPKNGHPSHFGEMYSVNLPNTKLPVRFGVKEWLRPAGKSVENVLRPDINIDLSAGSSPEKLYDLLIK